VWTLPFCGDLALSVQILKNRIHYFLPHSSLSAPSTLLGWVSFESNDFLNVYYSMDPISLHPCCSLDGNHCVFGKVIEGLDVVDKIELVGSQSGTTAKKVVIKESGEITE
jgi:hypothetical protein